MWYSLDDGKVKCDWCQGDFRNQRVLNVEISLATGRTQSPISEAMGSLSITGQGGVPSLSPSRIVDGLGEEALARYSPGIQLEGAVVSFREGNAVATVRYSGWDSVRADRRAISERVALDGALAVAAEVATGMGAAAVPVLSEAKRPFVPSLKRVPKVCDTVPDATVDKVAHGAVRRQGSTALLAAVPQPGTTMSACMWKAETSRFSNEGQKRVLTVTLAVFTDQRPGMGVFAATRQYRRLHLDQKTEGAVGGAKDYEDFTPLAGLGEQAFSVTKSSYSSSSGNQGVVVFQKRNVLAEVSFSGIDEEDTVSTKWLVDGAFTAAVDVDRALRS